MGTNETVASILQSKGSSVFTIAPTASVFDALTRMAERNVGALVVVEDERVVGVISERDCVRKVELRGRTSRDTLVSAVLSQQVISVGPQHDLPACMRLMTLHHVRHLPVLQGGQLLGLVSIGDLVKSIISAQATKIEQLESYISGAYPA